MYQFYQLLPKFTSFLLNHLFGDFLLKIKVVPLCASVKTMLIGGAAAQRLSMVSNIADAAQGSVQVKSG